MSSMGKKPTRFLMCSGNLYDGRVLVLYVNVVVVVIVIVFSLIFQNGIICKKVVIVASNLQIAN